MASLDPNRLKQLIVAILTAIRENEGFANKTKLLKLLYFADLENFRDNRETLTGFRWVFHLYGPWAAEYDQVLVQMEAEGVISIKPGSRADLDTQFISSREEASFEGLGLSLHAELAIKAGTKAWASAPTGEVLDYVYFHTEPMKDARRGEPLDFSSARHRDEVPRYRRRASGTSPQELRRARELFLKGPSTSPAQAATFTTPKYDDQFFASLLKLESEGD
jgi:hypothetical protein